VSYKWNLPSEILVSPFAKLPELVDCESVVHTKEEALELSNRVMAVPEITIRYIYM